ncbi:MAG: c-type cytochrome, partial [Chitinophagales bacterium]|nr:c-type cytochrome [Chitinophagales bacterium]
MRMYFWAIKVFKMFNRGNKIKLFAFLVCLSFMIPIHVFAYTPAEIDINNPEHQARIEEGQKLFKANCAACHKVDQKLTGPALAGVWSNWDSQEDLVHWVHNSQEVIASGNAHANKIYNEFNKMMMPPFGQLSAEQVVSIMEFYVQSEELGLKPGGGAAAATPNATVSADNGSSSNSGSNKWILIAAIGALALMAFALISITSKLEKIVDVKIEEREAAEKEAKKKGTGKKIVSILIIFGLVTLGYTVVKGAIDLGHSQGYEPEQPIKFSHALHAGQNKIDCQYCHSGAEKSRHAVIPSVAVCMNCHKYVQQGP